MSELVVVEHVEPGVALVTLNRPQRRNALSIELLDGLSDTILQLEHDKKQRVVILRGAGPVFSAGLDLKEAADSSLVEQSAASVERALWTIRDTLLIVVAAVHGGAFAGGAGLMAACDIVIATEDAKIGFPEARRGLLPALISGVLVPMVREGDLRELLLVGEPVGSQRALQLGLVQRVVPTEQLLPEAVSVARSVLAGGPQTIRATKMLINRAYRPETLETDESLVESHLAARHSEEAQEGLAAFLEKREPNWME